MHFVYCVSPFIFCDMAFGDFFVNLFLVFESSLTNKFKSFISMKHSTNFQSMSLAYILFPTSPTEVFCCFEGPAKAPPMLWCHFWPIPSYKFFIQYQFLESMLWTRNYMTVGKGRVYSEIQRYMRYHNCLCKLNP